MSKLKAIQEFLSKKRLAVAGVSRNQSAFANAVFEKMIRNGYDAVPVNPYMTEFRGKRCYARLTEIQPPVEGAVILTPKKATDDVFADSELAGIKYLWIQQECASPHLLEKLHSFDGLLITNECIFMFLEPVDSFHKIHRWLAKVFKKYPT